MIASTAEILTYLGKTSPTDFDVALVSMLQPLVEFDIKTYLGYDPEQSTYTEYIPAGECYRYFDTSLATFDIIGNNRIGSWAIDHSKIQVRNVPLRSVISVYEDPGAFAGDAPGSFSSGTLLTEGTHFYVDWDEPGISRSGMLVKVGAWPMVARSVKVTYVGGYTADELNGKASYSVNASPIKFAILVQIAKEYSAALGSVTQGGAGAVTSISLDDYSVAYDRTLNNWTTSLLDSVKHKLYRYRNLGVRLI